MGGGRWEVVQHAGKGSPGLNPDALCLGDKLGKRGGTMEPAQEGEAASCYEFSVSSRKPRGILSGHSGILSGHSNCFTESTPGKTVKD